MPVLTWSTPTTPTISLPCRDVLQPISLLSSWKEAEEGGYAIVGSPETMRQKLREGIKAAGCGILQGIFQVGSMPHEMAIKNMELFATEVMPALRAEFPVIP